jgi:hypothetical protein
LFLFWTHQLSAFAEQKTTLRIPDSGPRFDLQVIAFRLMVLAHRAGFTKSATSKLACLPMVTGVIVAFRSGNATTLKKETGRSSPHGEVMNGPC